VGFPRSRPYKKDDIGHVEQKNWTHVRRLLGYDRLEDPRLVDLINALYRECWEPLHNYFLQSANGEAGEEVPGGSQGQTSSRRATNAL